MKRFIYTAVAGAVLAAISSTGAIADPGNLGNGQKVVMCSVSLNTEILVKVKDIPEHLAQGDYLGGCSEVLPQ